MDTELLCLGFFTISVITCDNANCSVSCLRDAVFHRGRRNIHVILSNRERVGDISPMESQHLGPLIGQVGDVSQPITKEAFKSNKEIDRIYLRLFFIQDWIQHQPLVHGLVFSHTEVIYRVMGSFNLANVKLKPIPNYQPSMFSNVKQIQHTVDSMPDREAQPPVPGCMTKLMEHQWKAVGFIRQSESNEYSAGYRIWNHKDNEWVQRLVEDALEKGILRGTLKFENKGCILADDMGLGKTLTTLTLIQLSQHEAQTFVVAGGPDEVYRRSSATLIICPLSTLENWKKEIGQHFQEGSLPFVVFYGRDRKKIQFSQMMHTAIVLTTYESVKIVTEDPEGISIDTSDGPETSSQALDLTKIHWFRIVLDEAHYVKDPKTSRSQILLGMEAQRRLCLTGTPLQNNLGDLHNLIRFLRLEPWNHSTIWKQCVAGPVEQCDPQGIATLQTIMKGISLRRLKTSVLDLPEKDEVIVTLGLKAPWDQQYERMHETFATQFGRNRVRGQGWNSADFFGELVDLRQLCNHPAMIDKNEGRNKYKVEDSSKIAHLLRDLRTFLCSGVNLRAVIFSEFKRFLEIIGMALSEHGIGFTTHYGKTDLKVRQRSLEKFQMDSHCKVLLATIKTAGVGIDLRCAQKVYIMEPAWNPAMEEQAIDRLYRIGQKSKVSVVKYCIENSIEGHIFQIKQKKAELAMLSVPLGGNIEYELVRRIISEKGT